MGSDSALDWAVMAASRQEVWPHTSTTLPGSSVQGSFQARVLEWGAIAYVIREMQIKATMKYHYTHILG